MSRTARHLGRFDVAVVGAGFAGSILARILARQGRRVALVERGAHPRLALGESSTPLAALALERLAARFDLPDLHDLAAYGRWLARRSSLRRGLKRGFTFYRHEPGEPFRDRDGDRRLLVAASPGDAVADAHWLRSDVDTHLVREAAAAGVAYHDHTALDAVEFGAGGATLHGRGPSGRVALEAGWVVDGSGRGGFLARALPLADETAAMRVASGLLWAHVEGAASFVEAARTAGERLAPGPYPDEQAAVHHLLEEGWMYVLPFDHGVASCGFLLAAEASPEEGRAGRRAANPPSGPAASSSEPAAAWRRLLARYPTLAAQFASARAIAGPGWIPRIQHRRGAAAGDGYFLLPHAYAFVDPLFSTGIAWSLLAVERLAGFFEDAEGPAAAYADLLRAEANQIERLIAAAYAARRHFDAFVAIAMLYFATVSHAEARQRLLDPTPAAPWAWEGFLGAGEPHWEAAFAAAERRARADPEGLAPWVEATIAPRNVAGLADPRRRNLYPVDLALLVERAPLLGLTPEEVRRALPRLRGAPAGAAAYGRRKGCSKLR